MKIDRGEERLFLLYRCLLHIYTRQPLRRRLSLSRSFPLMMFSVPLDPNNNIIMFPDDRLCFPNANSGIVYYNTAGVARVRDNNNYRVYFIYIYLPWYRSRQTVVTGWAVKSSPPRTWIFAGRVPALKTIIIINNNVGTHADELIKRKIRLLSSV